MNKFLLKHSLTSIKKCLIIIAFTILFLSIQYSYCKTNKKAFSIFSINLDYVQNTNHNEFHDFWKPRPGFEISLYTPFYWGTLQLGIHHMSFHGQKSTFPDYKVYYYFLQWSIPVKLTKKISWQNGFRFGSYAMELDEDRVNQLELVESELAAGITSKIDFNFKNKWTFNLSGFYITIFTHKRIKLFFISTGLSRSFNTPGWIKKLLQ